MYGLNGNLLNFNFVTPSVSNNAFVGPGQGFSLIMLKTNNEPLGILGTKFSSAVLVGLYRRKSRYNKLTTNAGLLSTYFGIVFDASPLTS